MNSTRAAGCHENQGGRGAPRSLVQHGHGARENGTGRTSSVSVRLHGRSGAQKSRCAGAWQGMAAMVAMLHGKCVSQCLPCSVAVGAASLAASMAASMAGFIADSCHAEAFYRRQCLIACRISMIGCHAAQHGREWLPCLPCCMAIVKASGFGSSQLSSQHGKESYYYCHAGRQCLLASRTVVAMQPSMAASGYQGSHAAQHGKESWPSLP